MTHDRPFRTTKGRDQVNPSALTETLSTNTANDVQEEHRNEQKFSYFFPFLPLIHYSQPPYQVLRLFVPTTSLPSPGLIVFSLISSILPSPALSTLPAAFSLLLSLPFPPLSSCSLPFLLSHSEPPRWHRTPLSRGQIIAALPRIQLASLVSFKSRTSKVCKKSCALHCPMFFSTLDALV